MTPLLQVAGMACALSLDKEASSVTATAAQHLQSLAPEVRSPLYLSPSCSGAAVGSSSSQDAVR